MVKTNCKTVVSDADPPGNRSVDSPALLVEEIVAVEVALSEDEVLCGEGGTEVTTELF